MKQVETPETVAAYTGLSLASVRRYVLAVMKEKNSRKQYSKGMILNGLAIPVYESISERSTDEVTQQLATARAKALQPETGETVAPGQPEFIAPESVKPEPEIKPEIIASNSPEMDETIAPQTNETVAQDQPETVAPKAFIQRAINWMDQFMLTAINFIDIGLIFIGLWRLYETPGLALAVMVSLYFIKAQIIARNPELRQSNYNALQVVAWMCTISFFLHSITFWNANPLQWVELNGSGTDILNNMVKLFSAIGPAAFVSILAYKAVETECKIAKEKGK